MRKFLATLVLLLAAPRAEAQISAITVAQGAAGCIATNSCIVKLQSSQLVYTSGCTLTQSGQSASLQCSGAGSGGTLQAAYNASLLQSPSILLSNTPLTVKAPAGPLGPLFEVQQNSGVHILSVNDTTASSLDSVAALNLGTALATSINIGRGGVTTAFSGTVTGIPLQQVYNNSAGANPSILETAANGAVTIKGPAVANGTLFLVQDGVPNNLLGISDSGASRLDSVGALNLGTTTATSIAIGPAAGGSTTTVRGGLTQQTGAVSLTGNAASSFTTSAGALTLTSAAAATWSTSAGALTISGVALLLQSNGVNFIGLETQSGNIIDFYKNLRIDGGINVSMQVGTSQVDFSNGSGIFKTTTGASTFGGSSNTFTNTITLSANAGISGTAGTGALSLGTMTGDSNFPTGQFNWAGAAAKTASLVGASTFTISGGSGINLQKSGATVLDVGATAAGGASMASQKTFLLGVFTTAQLPAPACTAGQIVWDSTVGTVKYCASDNATWKALATNSEFNFSAFDSLTSTALIAPLSQAVVTNAATIASATFTVEVASADAGNYVEKLCSDGGTCGAGNVFVTCTSACNNAAGTVTSCTINASAVPAATTLSWSGKTACATANPAFNVNAHFTEP